MKTRLRVLAFGGNERWQELRREYLVAGVPVWYEVLDREDVPSFAWIGDACFGDTCGWVSKFAPFEKDGIKKV